MTTRVGIIEWLNNTMPLKEIIEKQLTPSGAAKIELSKIEAAQIHSKWIDKFASKMKSPGMLLQNCSLNSKRACANTLACGANLFC